MSDSRKGDSKKNVIQKDAPVKMTKQSYSNALAIQNKFDLLNEFPTMSKPSSSKSPSTFVQTIKSPPSMYFNKPVSQTIITLEPEFGDAQNTNFPTILKKVFPPDCPFISNHPLKDRKFFEHILIDSNSVEINHCFDPQDSRKINYSKLKILKVLTPSDWNQNIYTPKYFSHPGTIKSYNYLDYQKAWFNVFFIRAFSHSWFIQFSKQATEPFPLWFEEWWSYFGLVTNILPPPILEGFNLFSKKFSCNNKLLSFSSKFGVPWILAWTFQINNQENHIPLLVRQFRVKWWDTFNVSQANSEAISKFLNSKVWYPAKDPQHLEFLTQKSKIQALLAAASSKEDYVKLLEDVKSQLSSEDQESLPEEDEDESLDPNDFFSQIP